MDCDANIVIGYNMCRVNHSLNRPPVKAIATCETLYHVVQTTDYSRTPTITCPDGFVVSSCGLDNPWQQDDSYSLTAMKSDQNTCVVSGKCNGRLGCKIQAVCVNPIIKQCDD
ncbi:uncharacterized protein LOC141912308 [Tubulanus polymorphus]|uniref:uncharacterized protein LOC141912308 n=1 Tax=Tubulanus polymorphus TaxID=672921 RepID=UPI003DA42156